MTLVSKFMVYRAFSDKTLIIRVAVPFKKTLSEDLYGESLLSDMHLNKTKVNRRRDNVHV